MLPQSLIPSKAQLFCLSSVLVSLKMSQPNASNKSSLCHKNLDYPIPRTMYEKFVNKKWKERRDIFEGKKFLLQELTRFGKTEKHHLQRIILALKHLKYKTPKSKTPKVSPATVSAQTEIILSSSAAASSSTITTPTLNAHVANENRKRFLNEKENDILKKFTTELKVSLEQLFTDDVRNNQKLWPFLKYFYTNGKFSKFSETSMKEA